MNKNRAKPIAFKRFHTFAFIFGTLCATVTGGHAATVLPPKYLSVLDFQQCISKQSAGSYDTVCLPVARPAQCPKSSWRELSQLSGGQKVPRCH